MTTPEGYVQAGGMCCPPSGNKCRPSAIPPPPPPLAAVEVDCAPKCDVEMVSNTLQGIICAISRMPAPMQQQVFQQVGLPNDDVIYSYLRKMNPAMKQQIMREIMHQHPPTEPEIVDILRHLDISARRAVMASAGVSLEQSDVAEYLAERTPAEVQAIVGMAGVQLVPSEAEMVRGLSDTNPEGIDRILKNVNHKPSKEYLVFGLLNLCPDEQMQVVAQTNIRPTPSEDSIVLDIKQLRPDAVQRVVSTLGTEVISDEDVVKYLQKKSDGEKERLVKLSGLDIIENEEEAIGKAFANVHPQAQKIVMKKFGLGIYNYDDMIYGVKEMEAHKQIKLFRDANIEYTPTEQEIISSAQNQSESVKRQIFMAMNMRYKKPDLVEALKELEQGVLADLLHDLVESGAAFKLRTIVQLLRNMSIVDQQAVIDMAELKILPTEEQIMQTLLHRPPNTIFKLIQQAGVTPSKKHMLSLLLDFGENDQSGVCDLVRALRRTGIDVVNDEEIVHALLQRPQKQQEEILANVNPKMILANLENVSKQFSQLSAVKQKRWLHVLRGLTNGANMEFIIETLEHLDSVQLEHFMKLCRDKGIIQGHTFNKDELIEAMNNMDTHVKQEALEQSNILPTTRHLSYIFKNMDGAEVIKAMKAAPFSVPPTMEEAICSLAYAHLEHISQFAQMNRIRLFTENDVIEFLQNLSESDKKRIVKCARICLCDFQDVLNAFRCLSPQKQRDIACACGLMRRKLRLIR